MADGARRNNKLQTRLRRLGQAALFLASTVYVQSLNAANIKVIQAPSGMATIMVIGEIVKGDAAEFEEKTGGINHALVLLSSPGGDVDFERGMLFLRESKTGRKPVILNAPALAVLESLPRAGSYVIAGDDPGKPRSDLKRPWRAVANHAGLEGFRIHDLRHSFASIGAGSGMGLPIVGKLLGHAQPRTTQRYAHLDNDPLRRASEAIGATLAAAMGEKRSGEVVPLQRPAKAG